MVAGDVDVVVADVGRGHDQFAAGGILRGLAGSHDHRSVKQRRRFLGRVAVPPAYRP